MSKKYLVVGGVAGGMSAAARIRRLDPYADIQVFEKGPHVSFFELLFTIPLIWCSTNSRRFNFNDTRIT